jgi:hypothetical protein
MRMKSLAFIFLCLYLASSAAAQSNFQDANFSSGWSTTVLSGQLPASATAVATTVPTGGTGPTPPYRKVEHLNYNLIFAAHVHQPSIYDPATGAITSIDYSYDLLGFKLEQDSLAVAYRLLLVQNGTYYTGPTDQITFDRWTSFPTKRLLRANFTKVAGNGPDLPDFSCAGARITLGYLTANSTNPISGPTASLASGIDNWNVTVNSIPCTPPPPVVNPCCPPWTSTLLADMLFYQGSGGIAAPYTLIFKPASAFETQIQAYINYLNALNPAIHKIIIQFRLNDAGTGAAPTGGPQVGSNQHFVIWSAGGNGTPSNGVPNFFTLGVEPMQVNRWYRVNTGIFLNDGIQFFPKECADNSVAVRIQVQKSARGAVLQIRGADGRIVERQLTR